MATKKTVNEVYEELNKRVTSLEKLVQELSSRPHKPRKFREYTAEEKAAIRARLLAGQEAARKKREAEAKSTKKVKAGSAENGKIPQADQQ
jgi:hypothetical protein